MKKILFSVMALAIAAMTFTACEDVPEPYPMPDPNEGGNSTEVLQGTGTESDPFNVAAARAYIKDGGDANATVYVKGIIVTIEEIGGSYGNATYNISDDGTSTNQLKVYRGFGLGNSKFTTGDEIKSGDVVIVSGKLVNYNGTYEFTQGNVLYSLNGETSGSSSETGVATGDGSLENPFNSVAATNEAKKLASGAVSDKAYYIKGKVVSIATDKNGTVLNFDQGTFGNATFYISDDGTESNQFYCYRVLYLGNKKWTSGAGDILREGDDVIVCAKLTMYNSTPETQQNEGYLYSLNGKTESSSVNPDPQPTSDLGTADAPITVAKALEIIDTYEPAGQSATDAYVKGKIVSVVSYNEKYKSITYYISDDGTETNQLQVYSGKGLNGADFASKDDLSVGSVVVVKGQLKKYANKDNTTTPEINQNNQLVSIDGNTGEGGGQGSGGETSSSLTNGDFETWADGLPTGWKSASTASSATLTQSTDAHGGSYSVNVNGDEGSNKRLASQEITLAAGTYVFSFYAKATTADVSQVRPGYVPVADGKVGNYAYGEYANLTTGWTQVTHEFTLDAETTVCLVVMNPKKSNYSSGKDVLIDDATLTKK